jgi:hypothetical protein
MAAGTPHGHAAKRAQLLYKPTGLLSQPNISIRPADAATQTEVTKGVRDLVLERCSA